MARKKKKSAIRKIAKGLKGLGGKGGKGGKFARMTELFVVRPSGTGQHRKRKRGLY